MSVDEMLSGVMFSSLDERRIVLLEAHERTFEDAFDAAMDAIHSVLRDAGVDDQKTQLLITKSVGEILRSAKLATPKKRSKGARK